jgi:hypothetical protein
MQRIRERNSPKNAACDDHLAKMDVSDLFLNDSTESYYICPADSGLVKSDVLAVKIIPISSG